MNKRQKELLKLQLKDEREIQRNLKIIYQQALEDINAELLRLRGGDQTQSKIYQAKYQKQLREQVSNALDEMNKQQGVIIGDHLKNAYKRSFIGTMYDFYGQGVPFLFPVDGERVSKALFTNSKIKEGLYKKLGKDTKVLKRQIANEITRGIASGKSYHDITRNLNLQSQIGLGKANRIVRTEGHRIQNEAAHDAGRKAHENGADVVKQWDATLDGNTRTSHRVLDGQLRELDEMFTLSGKEAEHPGGFGIPEEDINCRCTILHRARWALDEDELTRLRDRAAFYGLDKSKDLEDFQHKYLDAAENDGILNIHFRGISKMKGNENIAVIEAFSSLPSGTQKKLSDITFEFGHNASAYDRANNIIRVGANVGKSEINHELGHAMEHLLMDAGEVRKYKESLVKGLGAKDIHIELYQDAKGNPVEIFVVKGKKFASEYQGRLYVDNHEGALNEDGTINVDRMGEAISEPYRIYSEDKTKLKDEGAIELIEGVLK